MIRDGENTDFTSFKIIGWGWMYLPGILDDVSLYIISNQANV